MYARQKSAFLPFNSHCQGHIADGAWGAAVASSPIDARPWWVSFGARCAWGLLLVN